MTTLAPTPPYDPNDPIQSQFKHAVHAFRTELRNDEIYQQILATKSIDEVYNATDKLQIDLNKRARYPYLRRISLFLENLRAYAEVIEKFLKIKPDILALIWGPIKLILQWASVLKPSLDAIVDTIRIIGDCLSEFSRIAALFQDTALIRSTLLQLFKDLLEFYVTALRFFSFPGWHLSFEKSRWLQHEAINATTQDISRNVNILRKELKIEQIEVENEARIRVFEYSGKVEKMQLRQEYRAIKNEILPKGYEGKLDWYRGRVCPGTEQWLLNNPLFQKWVDISDTSTSYLWLYGIPAAGKTFLSSLVVDKVNKLGHVLYAFLSYNFDSNASALSIIHSLLFQLATGHDDLQEVVCQPGWEKLKEDFQVAEDLLIKLINSTGSAYIVIDGLDEIEEIEQRRVLRMLESVSKACKIAKILVSCRDVDGIKSVLQDKPKIRIDKQNSSAIHQYASKETTDWLADASFTAEAEVEIRKLLEPLATTSEGMFLYTKVVFDNIKLCDNIDEVRSELRVLPKSLDDAYDRILWRINKSLSQSQREKVRKLLGWVGCATTPMTIQELEQALVIKDDSTADTIKVDAPLNAVKLCGPIVEVVDESVQFVHFTVKEYLFSSDISGHIDVREATLELAMTCLTYILTDLYYLDQSDDTIANRIQKGSYRLHNFATATWFDLIRSYLSFCLHDDKKSVPPKFINRLKDFTKLRYNDDMLDKNPKSSPAWLNVLKSSSPNTCDFLSMVAEFQKTRLKLEFNIKKGAAEWENLDPTCISKISVRVYNQFDRLFQLGLTHRSGGSLAELQRHYGSRPFKCPVASCPFFRTGFTTYRLRIAHLSNHELSWRCQVPECEYSTDRFLSKQMLYSHMQMYHNANPSSSKEVVGDLKKEDHFSFLFDIVKSPAVESIQGLMVEYRNLPSESKKEILRAAASSASSTTFNLLLEDAKLTNNDLVRFSEDFAELVEHGQTQKCEAITKKCLNTDGREVGIFGPTGYGQIAARILECDSKHMWELWVSFAQKRKDGKILMDVYTATNKFQFWCIVCKATFGHTDRQDTLIEWLKDLMRNELVDAADLVDVMKGATETACSATVVLFLLDNGVSASMRTKRSRVSFLQRAARNDTAESADIIQLLLYRGADPAPKPCRVTGKKLRDEIGIQNIKQWLGITFDELVEKAKRHREQEGIS